MNEPHQTVARTNRVASARTRAEHAAVVLCLPLILLTAGCAAFRPLDGIPAQDVPLEWRGQERKGMRTINLALLRQAPPSEYRLDSGDTLAIHIKGVLIHPESRELPPVHFPEKQEVPPSLGFPIPVRDDGTISLPVVGAMNVRGLTLRQAEEQIRQAYVERNVLNQGREELTVNLQRPRTYRVLVIRQESGNDVNNNGGQPGTFNPGVLKRGTGQVVNLPAYENDVLNAIARTNGLPGLDAENAIYVIRRGAGNAGCPVPQAQQHAYPQISRSGRYGQPPSLAPPSVIPAGGKITRVRYDAPAAASRYGGVVPIATSASAPQSAPSPQPSGRYSQTPAQTAVLPNVPNVFSSPATADSGQFQSLPTANPYGTLRSGGGRYATASNPANPIAPINSQPSSVQQAAPVANAGTAVSNTPMSGRYGRSPVNPFQAASGGRYGVRPNQQAFPPAQPVSQSPVPQNPVSMPQTAWPAPVAANQSMPVNAGQTPVATGTVNAAPVTQFQQFGAPVGGGQSFSLFGAMSGDGCGLGTGFGGASSTVGPGNAQIVRIPVRLHPGEQINFTQNDILLQDGDIVFIESRDSEVYYTGGLLGGGQYTLPRDYDIDIMEAISIAQSAQNGTTGARAIGGVSALNQDVTVSASSAVILRRLEDGTQVPIEVDLYKARRNPHERIRIQPGDFIVLQYTKFEAFFAFLERHLLEGALFGVTAAQLDNNRN